MLDEGNGNGNSVPNIDKAGKKGRLGNERPYSGLDRDLMKVMISDDSCHTVLTLDMIVFP